MTRIEALTRCVVHLEFGAKHGDKTDEDALKTVMRMIDMMELQRKKDAWHRWNAGLSPNRINRN